jgi:hypothetical protein
MSIIGMPSLAFLLVLTNFALCLGVDQNRHMIGGALSAAPHSIDRGEAAALTAAVPRPID